MPVAIHWHIPDANKSVLLLQAAEAKRVLILDWDVHHSNGTQQIFEHSPLHICSLEVRAALHLYENKCVFVLTHCNGICLAQWNNSSYVAS